jgi:ubiquinone/menaquinone biosynthesis C-methylase UbiE
MAQSTNTALSCVHLSNEFAAKNAAAPSKANEQVQSPAYLIGTYEQNITCCPACRFSLRYEGKTKVLCSNRECLYASEGFPFVNGQPVLIDFENSIFDRASYSDGCGSVLRRDFVRTNLRSRFRNVIHGTNRVAEKKVSHFIDQVKELSPSPRVLVIGGGTLGSGAKELYNDLDLKIIGTDVYASPLTVLLADGHQLPFKDEVFDGVWIQAVLEHVLEPQKVVEEIHRVLRAGGVVYADTPFMQQVHEKAYDFTRFTLGGHRWLFRRFDEIDSGAVGGAAVALRWSVRYFARAMGAGEKVSQAISMPFSLLRFVERFAKAGENADAASGVFFLGTKSSKSLHPKEMVSFYNAHR